MTIGIYKTTDPDKRVKIVFDEEYPTEIPAFPYAEGVLDCLIECYENGDYYGAILLERQEWARFTEDSEGNVTLHDCEEHWEVTDSIWGCAGYENPAAEIAKEFFNVEVTEKA